MLEKKVITVACAVGILACGACFLPPLPEHQPPPPPVLLDLQGIQRIRVEVTNTSESRNLDSDALARWIKIRINSEFRSAGVKAVSQKESVREKTDAVMQVTVLKESAILKRMEPDGFEADWDFQINISAVLAKNDGQVVWRESDGEYRFYEKFPALETGIVLRHPDTKEWLVNGIGQRLVSRMNGQ
jgi:hypothetical protein